MLKSIISRDILLAPGIYDALSGLIAEQAGARAVYLSGASIAYTRFGRSDVGLVSASEVHDTLAAVTDRIQIPVIVDADTGFGNALNVQRTIRNFERAGAAAIQIEDQSFPKRCGHLDGKTLISKDEMVGKIKAAIDARKETNTLIIARTDARGVEGLSEAIDRAQAYQEAGADILFIEAPHSIDEMKLIRKSFGEDIPLLANMVEGGKTPIKTANDLKSLGFNIVIFPGGAVRAATFQLQQYYAGLIENGSTLEFSDSMHNFDSLNSVIGTPELLKLGKKYE
ncbi:MAG: isocitrate lyase/phosphoenolpyruvate mutase family protein [Paracoccaceae bacterium]|jgi:2-methylisocitrate lyase-like PEP mutase family enzyme|nr:isocitrate lyase/phosphoenolpyruvate mutase family protein [Pseudomonadota bacterium]NCV48423.1 carboxyvinyl-carboxyphosphonate phosphorylmutase [Rhodobacterales bacterium]NCX53273.1 carboxyvinyl-carboxyphosphonate phosphorylmutase [Rhodobacterales bacterium]NCX86566.1 carboxyvinyl-carboxyphosphonate phosphorylmutase [Paracoccaceae bacterium]NDA29832.1 carboxyvinyl-carboxyphosphonate phosphorylmutase [Alphaproteobacteria bacterium]|tara:strand:+ start:283 stop:1131 length:849 start_codon:yes stop_codon:yes gene_type:complete